MFWGWLILISIIDPVAGVGFMVLIVLYLLYVRKSLQYMEDGDGKTTTRVPGMHAEDGAYDGAYLARRRRSVSSVRGRNRSRNDRTPWDAFWGRGGGGGWDSDGGD